MYHAFGLLLPSSDFTLAAAAQKLAARFPGFAVAQDGAQVKLARADWDMSLTLEDGPEVLEESIRMADHIGGAEEELGIAKCNRRVNVATDVPDPEMDHFNDYLTVIEVLQSFKGVIAVDPSEPSLL